MSFDAGHMIDRILGSSPRVRGTGACPLHLHGRCGFIPACAGNRFAGLDFIVFGFRLGKRVGREAIDELSRQYGIDRKDLRRAEGKAVGLLNPYRNHGAAATGEVESAATVGGLYLG